MKKRVLFLGMFLSSFAFADKYDVLSSTVDKFKNLVGHKALAVAVDEGGAYTSSWADGYAQKDKAIASALRRCNKGRAKYHVQSECVMYMVDDKFYVNRNNARTINKSSFENKDYNTKNKNDTKTINTSYTKGKALNSCREIYDELIKYYFVSNQNCINKKCGKVVFFTPGGVLDDNFYVIDFDKKIFLKSQFSCGHEKETPSKVGIQIGAFGDSYYITKSIENPNIFIFQNVSDSRFSNNIYLKAGNISSAWAENFLYHRRNEYTVRDIVWKFKKVSYSELGLNSENIIRVGEKSVKGFSSKYKLNATIQKWVGNGTKEWEPERGNSSKTVNGKGTIIFHRGENKNAGWSIKGNFKKGKLINGTLNLAYFYSSGSVMSSFAGRDAYFEKDIRVTSSSRLSSIIDKEFKRLKRKANNRENEIDSERREKHQKYSSSAIDHVQVEAECIRGLLPCIEKNLHISGGTGEFKPSFNGASSGTIYKGYQGKTSGTYIFTVTFDDKICSGNFHISGNKQHYSIKLGKDCHDNGSREW